MLAFPVSLPSGDADDESTRLSAINGAVIASTTLCVVLAISGCSASVTRLLRHRISPSNPGRSVSSKRRLPTNQGTSKSRNRRPPSAQRK